MNPDDPTMPRNYGPPPPPPKKTHHWYRPRNAFLGLIALVVLITVIVAVAGANSSTQATNHVQAGSVQRAASQPAYPTSPPGAVSAAPSEPSFSPSADPTTPAPTTPAPTTPAITTSQQEAIESAQNYLTDGQGFSEAGLLQQLTSDYGSGFSEADAQFAINQLDPDWYQQAAASAKNYMSDGQGFSEEDLYQQLTSAYGAGFTPGQADYALRQVGL